MLTLQQYTITADDTLASIAQAQLGDSSLWPAIAALNNLRAPYVGHLLTDQFGPVLRSLGPTLPTSITAGATTLVGWPGPAAVYAPGNIIVLGGETPDGAPSPLCFLITQVEPTPDVENAVTIRFQVLTSYKSLTQQMVVASGGAPRAFAAGAAADYPCSLFLAPTLLQAAVAQPGDTILLPIAAGGGPSGVSTASTAQQMIDALGTDLALDSRGRLAVGTNADLATVSGVADILQAVAQISQTAQGAQVGHWLYGVPYERYVGASGAIFQQPVLMALIREAYLRDPRIRAVPSVIVQTVQDTTYASVTLAIAQIGLAVTTGVIPVATR